MGLPGGPLNDEQQAKYKSEAAKYEETTEAMLQEVEYIRTADAEDIANYYDCRREENEGLLRARDILAAHNLDMKLVDVEYMLDRKKFFLYFTAEQRVDFRAYVRDLAHEFRTRIEMRQVGIRDEARIVRGIAPCGRPCCCGYWLHGFQPISIKIVKEQRSELNPTKISGLCGRLMCCMSYEKELYTERRSKLPGPGAKIRTEQGVYVLESLDIGREIVNIRFPSGRLVQVLISEFPDFQATVLRGEEWGEDKELAAKKKAMQERVALLEKRRERQRLRATAKAARMRRERIAKSAERKADSPKPKPKPAKQTPPAKQSQTPKAAKPQESASGRRRRNRKPRNSEAGQQEA
ncbi:MAG: stage 0 sporulation protein [Synergistaceae bacterium]|nr:stage 0 sporulation protein [Synergistaceae bacterium]